MAAIYFLCGTFFGATAAALAILWAACIAADDAAAAAATENRFNEYDGEGRG